ncbi:MULTISPECIES: hypothetical protein [unclassified Lentimonas]|uniref:hypothetical protein n=1 Tax=unclassified Lentimonas TaxID=2630993 RepID=UPI00132C1098|nr:MULTISPECIES: hypothetical protein [unclassified Lentimonas]CAA6689516.1 Unannotated [Lentimonas sp. CC10]CAA6691970.1 Unannotated [Lentimonas sp. CC19]CAA7070550.1 Unannotated [Lentimonas sp. CC11]
MNLLLFRQHLLRSLVVLSLLLTACRGVANESAVAAEFFAQTPMALGRDANTEGAVEGGRFVTNADAKGNIAGAWDLTEVLQEGVSYQFKGKVRLIDTTTGGVGYGRVLVRFGSGLELTTLSGQKATTLFDKTVKGEAEFTSYIKFSNKMPLFGALGLNLGPGVRVELYDIHCEVSTPPWAIIPKKAEKLVLINDVLVQRNKMREGKIAIPPGATEAHVKVTYALPEILSTSVIRGNTSTSNELGFKVNRDVEPPEGFFLWRDGDDHDIWLTFKIKNPRTNLGDGFRASISGVGLAGWFAFEFEIVEGAVNELPEEMPYHRPPYALLLPEQPTLDLDMTAVEWDETGLKDGRPVWRTHPSHSHLQSGNGETGVYYPWAEKNAYGEEPHSLQVDAEGRPYVKLHSKKLAEPLDLGNGKLYPHQASMLQAQKLDEWCHRRGIYSAQVVLPSRRGAWSAFWACGRRGPERRVMWPPEIDFLESFNGAYGAKYWPDTSSAGQHAGMHGSVKRESIDGFAAELSELGFSAELDFNTQIHDITAVIEDDWITHFRDGVEFFRQRNILDPADGNTDWDFYPIINVAVKDASGGAYDQGTGDMRWYGMQYYALDSGYELVPYPLPRPYPNREILPRPKM